MSTVLIQPNTGSRKCLPAIALARLIWQRHRWSFIAMAAYWVLLSILVHVVTIFVNWEPILFMPLGSWCVLNFLIIFTNLDSDFKASAYPKHVLRLPVSTASLVIWPMLYGVASVVITWLLFSLTVFIPMGFHVPLLWPALMVAAILTCTQALSWSSLGVLGIILGVIALPGTLGFGLYGWFKHLPADLMDCVFLSVIGICFPVALSGMPRTRRGETLELRWFRSGRSSHVDIHSLKPFTSPEQAQDWYETRDNGMLVPKALAGLLATVTLLALFDHSRETLWTGRIEVTFWQNILPLGIFFLPWCGLFVGVPSLKESTGQKKTAMSAFYITRPLNSSAFVGAKMRAAMSNTLAAWAVMLAFLIPWLFSPAYDYGVNAPLCKFLLGYLTFHSVVLVFALGLILVLMTWKNMVETTAFFFTGRNWVPYTYIVVVAMSLPLGVSLVETMASHPVRMHYWLAFLPYVLSVLVVIKLSLVSWLLSALVSKRLITVNTVLVLVAVWLIAAGALFGAAIYLLPRHFANIWEIATGAILLMPGVRMALAPLAMDMNRHQ